MRTRTLIITALVVFLASFGAPHSVFAQVCTPTCSSDQTCVCSDFDCGCVSGGASGGSGGSTQTSVTNTSQTSVTNTGSGPGTPLINPLKGVDCSSGNGNCLTAFLNSILDFVIQIGSIIVILMIVFVGYKFVVAQGKPAEIEEAKKMLLWTLIGALVLLGAKAISLGIMSTVQALGG